MSTRILQDLPVTISRAQIDLEWIDKRSNESGFRIERSPRFDLDITAENRGAWSDALDMPAFCFGSADHRVFLLLVLE